MCLLKYSKHQSHEIKNDNKGSMSRIGAMTKVIAPIFIYFCINNLNFNQTILNDMFIQLFHQFDSGLLI